MARDAVERPHWQHSDGHRYDEIDFGFTRFVDAADAAADDLHGNRRRIAFRLRRLVRFRHAPGTDTSRNPR